MLHHTATPLKNSDQAIGMDKGCPPWALLVWVECANGAFPRTFFLSVQMLLLVHIKNLVFLPLNGVDQYLFLFQNKIVKSCFEFRKLPK